MRILILGGDGYLGWPTAMRFSARGHEVSVVDNFSRRRWHVQHSTGSLTPIRSLADRVEAWQQVSGNEIGTFVGSMEDADFLERVVAETLPEAVFYELGGVPTARIVEIINERHGLSMLVDEIVARKEAIFLELVTLHQFGAFQRLVFLCAEHHFPHT